MSHLNPDQLIDALEGVSSVDARRHLEECESCQTQLADLSLTLNATQNVEAPEPSPLFWQHFSARVRSGVEAESVRAGGWPQWLQLPILAPLAGLALVIAVLIVTLPKATRPLPIDVAEAQSSDALLNDDGWTLVAEAVGDIDWDTATEAGLMVAPDAADRVVVELTADQRRELTALLQVELQRAKS